MVITGELKQVKGRGASGSFRLGLKKDKDMEHKKVKLPKQENDKIHDIVMSELKHYA